MLQDRSVELLYSLPLFTGWDPVSLQAIAYVNARLYLAPGESLLRAGEEAEGATLILNGAARPAGALGEEAVRQYGPGFLFDEMAMFVPVRGEMDLVVETPLEALRISRERMQDILRNDPAMAGMLAERIQGRLIGIAERLREVGELLGPEAEDVESGAAEPNAAGGELSAADRTPPEPERDPTDAPSPAPRQRPASSATPRQEVASPRHGPAVAPGSTGASPVHGSSTT